ncbi:MAG: apolipoprotein N-acyltransferase [Candidatus Delongbacteria bacterium]|nr:apolipoprotein N-acyltransferase [Candidatus Delongbacteria bacterium]
MKIDNNKYSFLLSVAVSGALLGYMYPPITSSYAVFLILIPFFHQLMAHPEKSVKISFVFGLFLSFTSTYWIFYNAGAGEMWIRIMSGIGLFIVNATYYAIFGLLYNASYKIFKDKAVWTIPILWGGMEHLMLYEEMAFPWTFIAHTLTGKTEFIQITEYFGVISVSMLAVFISVLLYLGLKNILEKKYFQASINIQLALLIIFGSIIFGHYRLNDLKVEIQSMPSIKAALIHPGLDVEYKWEKENFKKIIETQFSLSDRSLNENPSLIIWGESNFPRYLENNPSYIQDFILYSAKNNVDLCVGSPGYDYFPETESFKKYNSVFYFDQNNNMNRYDKRKLVPFGESFPYSWILTFLKDISLGQSNFDKGENNEPFVMTDGTRFHTNICYEALFPYYNSSIVMKGSQFIVNVSNDAWYEGTKEIYQHSRFNVFRAIENRRSVVRLANKAENSLFLPSGEQNILFDASKNIQKVVSVPLNDKLTIFSRFGHYFASIVIIINSLFLIFGFIAYIKHKNGR